MELREFGRSGLRVSPLGFGAMHIGDARTSESEAAALLGLVLDLGITLIDTARSYGESEARIGRHLAHRRSEFLLSTKVGYGVEGVPDWTYDCILGGVERALRLMRSEVLDIVHLHSCPLEILRRGEVSRALEDCRRAGKIRIAAYSGDNAELAHAIASGEFGALQCSLSVCDQAHLARQLPEAAARGLGVIAKRPLAGAIWRRATRPDDPAEGAYWDRWQAMDLGTVLGAALPGADWQDLALRFAAHLPGVSACIVGTARPEHLRANLAAIERGPLPPGQQDLLRQAFETRGTGWPAMI